MYKDYIISMISKVIRDELTSSLVYIRMAESLEGMVVEDVAKILREHADEEYGHYKELVAFAYNHNITPIINIDYEKINTAPTNLEAVIMFTQSLETTAIEDYKSISLKAKDNNDVETMEFFKELIMKEMEHFDDLASFVGQKRDIPCNEPNVEDKAQEIPTAPTPITLRSLVGI